MVPIFSTACCLGVPEGKALEGKFQVCFLFSLGAKGPKERKGKGNRKNLLGPNGQWGSYRQRDQGNYSLLIKYLHTFYSFGI